MAAPATVKLADMQLALSVISHTGKDGKVDWDGVGADVGITHAKNALAKFQSMVTTYGWKHKGGVLEKMTDTELAAPRTPRQRKKPTKAAASASATSTLSSAKKRKVQPPSEDQDDGEEEAGSGEDEQD